MVPPGLAECHQPGDVVKHVFVLLTLALSACVDITGTPTSVMKGRWTLQRYAGHALPALEETYGGDSVFIVADTLWFDGRGNYTSKWWISVRTPTGTSGGGGGSDGTYTAAGQAVVLHALPPEGLDTPNLQGVPDPTTYGRRIADALLLSANTTTPTKLYVR